MSHFDDFDDDDDDYEIEASSNLRQFSSGTLAGRLVEKITALQQEQPLTRAFTTRPSHRAMQTQTPKRSAEHPIVTKYKANHGSYAVAGVTLCEFALDHFVNDDDAGEPSAALIAEIEAESAVLQAAWMNGEITNPFDA